MVNEDAGNMFNMFTTVTDQFILYKKSRNLRVIYIYIYVENIFFICVYFGESFACSIGG